jgi:peroxiredoxin
MSKDLNNSYKVSGSKGSTHVKFLTENLNTCKNKLDSLEKIIDKAFKKPGFDTIYSRVVKQYVNIIKEERNVSIKFIIENNHSLASIIALYQQLNDTTYVLNQNRDLQFVNIVADTLKKYHPEVSSVKILLADRSRMMQNYNILKLGQMRLHSKAVSFPDVSLTSVDKEKINLRQVKSKNKLVLINFWAPDNEECIIVLNNYKELYNEFKAKGFEIYNIAVTDDQQNWEDLVKSGNLAGINVIDKEGTSASFYNVKNLPASYLIGLDENIIGKDLFGENLRSKLKELLK